MLLCFSIRGLPVRPVGLGGIGQHPIGDGGQIVLGQIEPGVGVAGRVSFSNQEIELFQGAIPFGRILSAGQEILCAQDFFFQLYFRGQAVSVFKNLVSQAQILWDMLVITQIQWFAGPGQVVKIPSFLGFLDAIFNDLFKTGNHDYPSLIILLRPFRSQALEKMPQLGYASTVITIVHSFFGFQGLK
jgi:hypothetical protein